MKMKCAKFIIPLIFSITSLTGCNKYEGTDSKEVDAYYANYNLDAYGNFLEDELQRLCFNTHKIFITYDQVNSYYSQTATHDSVEAVPSTITKKSCKNQWFYTGKEASGYGTREHVWPCANSDSLWEHGKQSTSPHNVDKGSYKGGGSDLYHVRTANSKVNTARGNGKFVDFDDPEFAGIKNSVKGVGEKNGKYQLLCQGFSNPDNIEYSDRVEVDDSLKGDVARILCYVFVHYRKAGILPTATQKTKEDMLGNLTFTNILGYDTDKRCCQKLIEWNQLDPVNDIEKHRNDAVQKIQGNRNPFVDHPELVQQMLEYRTLLP